jgi:branched-chain amino acid transport system ATP-binding protein
MLDVAEKIIVLDHGQKIAKGTPQEIRENQEVRRVYLGQLKL